MSQETGQGAPGGPEEPPSDQAQDHDQVESGPADEGPSYGDRPSSPEPGHPTDQTQPMDGVPPRAHEEPQDIPPPPQGEGGPADSSEGSQEAG